MTRLAALIAFALASSTAGAGPRTTVAIEGEQFFVNGRPTYEGRTWKGHRIEGLLFYFGQDQNLEDEAAVLQATDNATGWLLDAGYRNVVVEVANECDNDGYDRSIIMVDRVDELMRRIKANERGDRRLLVGVSYNGNTVPTPDVVRESDFILIHGNGVKKPERITEMVNLVRAMEEYRPMPIVFNEDDHYDFEKDTSNMTAAVRSYASWGFFDFRREGEGFSEGFQSVPVDWKISSERKKAFFRKVKEITGC